MYSVNRFTGEPIGDLEHLKQSIIDILATPIGTRVICREYGSNLFNLLDKPINKRIIADIYIAVSDAIGKWEPRLKLEKISIQSINDGHIILDLIGIYRATGEHVNFKGVTI